MNTFPFLKTSRLILRAFAPNDAPAVGVLANDIEIAANTENLPHPYTEELAVEWIASHQAQLIHDRRLNLAIVDRKTKVVMGAIGLEFNASHHHAEIGYWIGRPFWNNGFATEASLGLIRYGFNQANLHRIFSVVLKRNATSRRVMEKLGMTFEGCLREHHLKWGIYEDLEYYGITRSEWQQRV
jgi:ribosomal-protein-alanine N-acetyltransferase